jgi:hypothetical protein
MVSVWIDRYRIVAYQASWRVDADIGVLTNAVYAHLSGLLPCMEQQGPGADMLVAQAVCRSDGLICGQAGSQAGGCCFSRLTVSDSLSRMFAHATREVRAGASLDPGLPSLQGGFSVSELVRVQFVMILVKKEREMLRARAFTLTTLSPPLNERCAYMLSQRPHPGFPSDQPWDRCVLFRGRLPRSGAR